LLWRSLTTFIHFRYQSGFQPPNDIPFEDLSKADNESSHNSQINYAMNNNATMKGTVSGKGLKKRVGIFGIFSSNKVSDPHASFAHPQTYI
jgi:hypothetical protein